MEGCEEQSRERVRESRKRERQEKVRRGKRETERGRGKEREHFENGRVIGERVRVGQSWRHFW